MTVSAPQPIHGIYGPIQDGERLEYTVGEQIINKSAGEVVVKEIRPGRVGFGADLWLEVWVSTPADNTVLFAHVNVGQLEEIQYFTGEERE